MFPFTTADRRYDSHALMVDLSFITGLTTCRRGIKLNSLTRVFFSIMDLFFDIV